MDCVRLDCQALTAFTLVCDDRCEVVQRLARIIRRWDSQQTFQFVMRTGNGPSYLLEELDRSPWSLMLIDEENQRWNGPEAIPIIFKNLPFGKIAAALYILPGTMWLTQSIYMMVSRHRQRNLTESTAVSLT